VDFSESALLVSYTIIDAVIGTGIFIRRMLKLSCQLL